MTEELQKKAEDFIIERYKIAKSYREDNAETREYMRMDVHSQYEEEYQLYLAATKELQKENAELKEKLLEQKQYTAFKCNEAVKKKEVYEREHYLLTKAKELLKQILSYEQIPRDCLRERYRKLLEEAEQFIKDSEVEK